MSVKGSRKKGRKDKGQSAICNVQQFTPSELLKRWEELIPKLSWKERYLIPLKRDSWLAILWASNLFHHQDLKADNRIEEGLESRNGILDMALYLESDLAETLSRMEEVSHRQPSPPKPPRYPVAFRNLPREIRDQIYQETLQHHNAIVAENGYIKGQRVAVGLLRANRTIYAEACPVLYGQNRFDLRDMEADSIITFFRQIGRRNAAYLRKIAIDFLDIDITGPLEFHVLDGSVRVMAAIQHHCVNLTSLTVSLLKWHGMEKMDVRPFILCGAWLFESALKLLANQMRNIPTLQRMEAIVYDRHLEHVEHILPRHGFTFHTVEWPEGMRRSTDANTHPFRTARSISWHRELTLLPAGSRGGP